MALLLVMPAALAGCGRAEDGAERPERIMASIYPLADLARQVAGDAIEVDVLVPPGVTPHGFELTTERVRRLAGADLVLVVGMGVDPWAQQAAQRLGAGAPVWSMAEMVGRDDDHAHGHAHDHHHHGHDHDHDHGHDHTGPNPHLWLDPVLARRYVQALAEALAERYPDRAGAIQANAADVRVSLEELDAEHERELATLSRRRFVTFHNAFDLLAERYGLEVVAHLTPVDLSPGGEVVPARLRAAIDAVREHDLHVVYAEPQFPESAVRALQRETGVAVMRLDPLGHPDRDGYETYQAMMRSNLATLLEGQRLAAEEGAQP